MAGQSELDARVRALEQALDRQRADRSHGRRWLFLGLLILCSMIAAQSWFISHSISLQAHHTKEHMFWLLCHDGATEQQRIGAFRQLIHMGNTEWRSARLERLDLTGIRLEERDLRWANFEGSKLIGAQLARAVLTRSGLKMADLSGADLSGANLVEADLFKADLRRAQLTGANLRGASLEQANATEALFTRADLTGATLTMTDLVSADLVLADLTDAILYVANLRSANLFLANLSGTELRRTDLKDTNWWRARGLRPETIADFNKRFPPSEQASEKLRQDYRRWLEQRGEPARESQ